MQASAYLAVSDLKRALAHAYSTLLVKADTEWTVASPRCLTFFIMYTLINTDWPGVEACHLFIFPQHTHPLQPSTPAPIAHLSFSFPPSPLRTWMPSIPFLVHLSALIRSFHCPAITPSIWLSRSFDSGRGGASQEVVKSKRKSAQREVGVWRQWIVGWQHYCHP